jgi:hypothetical protein
MLSRNSSKNKNDSLLIEVDNPDCSIIINQATYNYAQNSIINTSEKMFIYLDKMNMQ